MNEQNANPPKGKKVLFIILLLIIILSGGYFWQRFGNEIQLFFSKIQTIIKPTPQTTNLQDNTQKETGKEELIKTTDWKLITVINLVRMADLTLNTTGNVKAALAFLLTAKKYADDFSDPTIARVLNKDIAKLQAVPIVDFEELVIKIDAASKQIDNLPIIPPASVTAVTPTEVTDAKKTSSLLNRFFTSFITALKNIVIIRHHATEPILPPEQVAILRFNIQNKLLQAELAVMQKQNKIYQMCLTQSIDLITKYFAENKNITTNILQTLKELRQINLQPELPQLSESLITVQKFAST